MAQQRASMKKVTPRVQAVGKAEQIGVLASAVRQDIVDTLAALGGEADVAAVAAQMGRPSDGLYYHFDLLDKAGLLQRLDRGDGPRRYRVGRQAGARLRLDYRADSRSGPALARVVDGLLASAKRDFRQALARREVATAGTHRELWAGRVKGWVDDRGLAKVNRLLEQLQQALQGPRRPGCDRLLSLSFVLAPATARPRRRGGKDGKTR